MKIQLQLLHSYSLFFVVSHHRSTDAFTFSRPERRTKTFLNNHHKSSNGFAQQTIVMTLATALVFGQPMNGSAYGDILENVTESIQGIVVTNKVLSSNVILSEENFDDIPATKMRAGVDLNEEGESEKLLSAKQESAAVIETNIKNNPKLAMMDLMKGRDELVNARQLLREGKYDELKDFFRNEVMYITKFDDIMVSLLTASVSDEELFDDLETIVSEDGAGNDCILMYSRVLNEINSDKTNFKKIGTYLDNAVEDLDTVILELAMDSLVN